MVIVGDGGSGGGGGGWITIIIASSRVKIDVQSGRLSASLSFIYRVCVNGVRGEGC